MLTWLLYIFLDSSCYGFVSFNTCHDTDDACKTWHVILCLHSKFTLTADLVYCVESFRGCMLVTASCEEEVPSFVFGLWHLFLWLGMYKCSWEYAAGCTLCLPGHARQQMAIRLSGKQFNHDLGSSSVGGMCFCLSTIITAGQWPFCVCIVSLYLGRTAFCHCHRGFGSLAISDFHICHQTWSTCCANVWCGPHVLIWA